MVPHTVVNVQGNIVHVDVNVRRFQLSIDKLSKYERPDESYNGHGIEPNIIGNHDDTIPPNDYTEATDVELDDH